MKSLIDYIFDNEELKQQIIDRLELEQDESIEEVSLESLGLKKEDLDAKITSAMSDLPEVKEINDISSAHKTMKKIAELNAAFEEDAVYQGRLEQIKRNTEFLQSGKAHLKPAHEERKDDEDEDTESVKENAVIENVVRRMREKYLKQQSIFPGIQEFIENKSKGLAVNLPEDWDIPPTGDEFAPPTFDLDSYINKCKLDQEKATQSIVDDKVENCICGGNCSKPREPKPNADRVYRDIQSYIDATSAKREKAIQSIKGANPGSFRSRNTPNEFTDSDDCCGCGSCDEKDVITDQVVLGECGGNCCNPTDDSWDDMDDETCDCEECNPTNTTEILLENIVMIQNQQLDILSQILAKL